MFVSLSIQNPRWILVYEIPEGTVLMKGRHGLYWPMREASRIKAGDRDVRFGCYSWAIESEVAYCGSFTKDYTREEFQSNLEGRVHHYLQSHSSTNHRVFSNINKALQVSNIYLRLFVFDSVTVDDEVLSFASCSTDPYIIRAVERLLIFWYHSRGQCTWNMG